jgi:hypothetical protein
MYNFYLFILETAIPRRRKRGKSRKCQHLIGKGKSLQQSKEGAGVLERLPVHQM